MQTVKFAKARVNVKNQFNARHGFGRILENVEFHLQRRIGGAAAIVKVK